MNIIDMLNPYRWLLLLGLCGALVLGYFGWEKHIRNDERAKVVTEYNKKIDDQKAEAQKVLAQAIADRDASAAALRELTVNLEKAREISQAQNAADLRARRAGPRLQFVAQVAGCGGGSPDSEGGTAKPASDAGSSTVQLPQKISDDLWDYAGDFQSLIIDYSVLKTYVDNPKLVCELQK